MNTKNTVVIHAKAFLGLIMFPPIPGFQIMVHNGCCGKTGLKLNLFPKFFPRSPKHFEIVTLIQPLDKFGMSKDKAQDHLTF